MADPLLATTALGTIGLALGSLLAAASRLLKVEGNALVAEIEALLPGTQCGQCGFAGCAAAAAALVEGKAPPTLCPPGGSDVARQLAAKLGIDPGAVAANESVAMVARVEETLCIGCTRCFKVCPTDAVIGAAKSIHNIFRDACTGCGRCLEVCPTAAISLEPPPITLQNWVWPKPTERGAA
ncbi:MAG: RnfABCDGE type electron transport complex subunit B [Hydrogenophilus sp.]|nr:RnfABCDGE type electron transport complex subunit B [Hydrogenophilus sp.]